MHYVGNDIVDLAAAGAEGKAGDARFLQKVFTGDERRAVLRADHPDRLLWTFWAAKETAYKAVAKSCPAVAAWPGYYRVMLDPEADTASSGIVMTPHGRVLIKIAFYPGCIHCIGTTGERPDLEAIVSANARSDACGKWAASPPSVRESLAVRHLAIASIAERLGMAPENIRIVRHAGPKGKGPPQVYFKGGKAPVDISLSHDGRFVAYAFSMAA